MIYNTLISSHVSTPFQFTNKLFYSFVYCTISVYQKVKQSDTYWSFSVSITECERKKHCRYPQRVLYWQLRFIIYGSKRLPVSSIWQPNRFNLKFRQITRDGFSLVTSYFHFVIKQQIIFKLKCFKLSSGWKAWGTLIRK